MNNDLAQPLGATADSLPTPEVCVGPTAEAITFVELPAAGPVPVPDGPKADVIAVSLSLKPATSAIPSACIES